MTAALGAHLVLDVHGGSSGALHGANGAGDIEGASPPRVDVDQQRQRGDFGDTANIDQHIFHAADPKIGHAKRVGSHSSAGKVKRAEARCLRHARRVGVDGADHLERVLLLDGGPETCSRRGLIFSTHVVPFSLILNGRGLVRRPHHRRRFVVEWVA